MKEQTVYLNGKYLKKSRAKVSFLDHGLLYGDGVFETLRVYEKKVFKTKAHINRLFTSADNIFLNIPLNFERIKYIIYKLISLNSIINGYVRITVTRGTGEPGLDLSLCKAPTVIVYAKELRKYPSEFYSKGVSAIIASTVKNHPLAINPSVKSCNFLNNIMAKAEAGGNRAFEAIMLSTEGHVTEGSFSNVFIVMNDMLLTPPLETGLLGGITRNVVIELARKSGIRVHERNLSRRHLYAAQECFITSSLMEIMPVTRIDRKKINNGKPGVITNYLMAGYAKLTGGLNEK